MRWKNLVKSLLCSAGFEVCDLRVDVLPATVVGDAKKADPPGVRVSGLLTAAIQNVRNVLETPRETGLEGTSARRSIGPSMIDSPRVEGAVCDSVDGMRIIESWEGS